jgi:hypothetical protein
MTQPCLFERQMNEAVENLCQTIGARLTAVLVAIVSHIVGRGHYVRRNRVCKRLRREGKCCRCGSTQSRRFSRNGFRSREPLIMLWGEVPFALPRVRCKCGGSVKIDFGGLIRSHQRIGDDVDTQIQRLAGIAVSLRQMRELFGQLRSASGRCKP